ncbi:MAG: peptidylprolyl isomerase [Lachnospiraceae bacterium]|nr:peptidylprolyl isomerase [Lachnospiraceae bacterium]
MMIAAAALSVCLLAACGSSGSGSSSAQAQTEAAAESAEVTDTAESGGAGEAETSADTAAPETEAGKEGSSETAIMLPKGAFDISGDELVFADIEIENYGTITVALDKTIAPVTVKNFVNLANEGFYDGLTFHRIMNGFMMQGGDPNGNGSGGSGTTIEGEFSSNGVVNPITHVAGAISMARAKDPNSASSQFFIVQKDSTFLDGNYAAFGYVISGQDIVDRICSDAKPTDSNGTIKDEEQPIIRSITVRENMQ